MKLDGTHVRNASRIFAVGLALLVLRAAVACTGTPKDTESDSCQRRGGHCDYVSITGICSIRNETAFDDTCLCCVPNDKLMNGDDDDTTPAAATDAGAPTGDGAATDGGGSTDAGGDSAPPADSGDGGADAAG